jgi:orotate phosphoribosyltransferase
MSFNLDSYHEFAIEKHVPGFWEEGKVLSSGIKSYWYWDGERFLDYVPDTRKLVRFVLDYCEDRVIMPDYFLGVPEGTNRLVDALNLELGGKIALIRKKPKFLRKGLYEHFSGLVEPGDKPIIVEDVTTTGNSLIKQLKICLDAGLEIKHTLGECDRLERAIYKGKEADYGAVQAIAKVNNKGIQHHTLTDAKGILPLVYERLKPGEEIARRIEEEYRKHGIVEIKLL